MQKTTNYAQGHKYTNYQSSCQKKVVLKQLLGGKKKPINLEFYFGKNIIQE